ncbi:hypothetical protein BDW22DRAFT_1432565 [Trametopsis cervina]|nr:hypothetical protein BDW22DRAFT_1432565 [Trametopsis cervina]
MNMEEAVITSDSGAERLASKADFEQWFSLIMDPDCPVDSVETCAWRLIVEQWAQGWTHELVAALVESHIDVCGFLEQLLRRILVTMLGRQTYIVGTYSAEFPYRASAPPVGDSLAADLHRLIDCGHPGLENIDTFRTPWGNSYHAPSEPTWAPKTPHVPRRQAASPALDNILRDAHTAQEDINTVYFQILPHFQTGLSGIGQSAEVRAFLACYLSSLYSPMPNVMVFHKTSRSARTMDALMKLDNQHIIALRNQLFPVLSSGLRREGATEFSWHSIPMLPLSYFFIHFSECTSLLGDKYIRSHQSEIMRPIMTALSLNQADFPMIKSNGAPFVTIPLSTVIAWILEWQLLVGRETKAKVEAADLSEVGYKRIIPWIYVVTPSDVDACTESLHGFGLATIWQGISPSWRRLFLAAVLKETPRKYESSIKSISKELLHSLRDTATSNADKMNIAHFCIRLVALGDPYMEAYSDMILELGKDEATVLFSVIIRFFNPFPTKSEEDQIKDVQRTYEEAKYTSAENLPPHLVDRFLQVMTDIARYSTIIAQALCDAGVLTLVSSIRDGWHNHPSVEDEIPPQSRKQYRQAICDNMTGALSERLYIASQAKLLHESPGQLYTHAPGQSRAYVRRRPSWMATGG